MSKWILSACIGLVGAALVATDVEARRFGGARSLGAQRSITPPPARPAPSPAAAANKAKQGEQPAPGGSRWGTIFGGLALGGLLGYLFAGNGLGGLVLLALLAGCMVLLLRAAAQRRVEVPRPVALAGGHGSGVEAPMVREAGGLPAGFDAPGFLRGAKRNFLRLQVANDAGALDEIRELVTDEMFEALRSDLVERPGGQHTEVSSLEADLVELATDKDMHWASVRFSGRVRESAAGAPQAFEEVWNLVKPVDGSSGWLLAGIQQMH